MTIPRVLVIAGSDSGGGAGIQGDIRTLTMLGCHPMTAITAITAQNTIGVTAVHLIPTAIVLAQVEAVLADIGADAIKLGMIGSAETAEALVDRLHEIGLPIVVDPVMVATSGDMLADQATIAAFARLLDLATVATPNAPELAVLAGGSANDMAEALVAARLLVARHSCAIVVKGGHLDTEYAGVPVIQDVLVTADGEERPWSAARIDTRHSHGTGCTLASGIAAGLAAGLPLERSVGRARGYLRRALRAAPGLGEGHGPIGHALGAVPFDVMMPLGTELFHSFVAASSSCAGGKRLDPGHAPCFKLERDHPMPLAGVDEVGRGPLAGPVVAAAVILDRERFPRGIDDSKKLTADEREGLYRRIRAQAICVGVGLASVEEIDEINIYHAAHLAMIRAVANLECRPAMVLVDGNRLPKWEWTATAIVAGDARCRSIAAASIIAKVTRDRIMCAHHEDHPGYEWASNKGYATPYHRRALQRLGPTALHRRFFAPVAACYGVTAMAAE